MQRRPIAIIAYSNETYSKNINVVSQQVLPLVSWSWFQGRAANFQDLQLKYHMLASWK
jgi:hypothetical protein